MPEALGRLRVLQIVEATLAGVGRHALDLSEGLADAGHQVHLIYSPRRMDLGFKARLAEIAPKLTAVSRAMLRRPDPSDLLAAAFVRRYARKHGPFEVIHGHSSKGGLIARLAAAASSSVAVYTPNAISTMNPETHAAARGVFGAAERILAWGSDAIIAVSPEEEEHLAGHLAIARRRLFVVPNCIRPPWLPSRAEAREALGLPPDAPIVGFVGRLERQKAPEILLRAFARVREELPEARLAIVGTGSMRAELEREAVSLGISGGVDWLGERNGQQAMPALDVFALASRYEGLPYVLIEALSAGLPIVTTTAAGARTLVVDGWNGRLVPPEDVGALAGAIGEVLGASSIRAEMAMHAREHAKRFELPVMVEGVLSVYSRVLSKAAP